MFNVPSYLPDSIVPFYERATKVLVDLLTRFQVIQPSSVNEPAADVDGLKMELNNVQDRISSYEKEVSKLERKQYDPARYGIDGEFQALDGQCIKKNTGDYTYEFCFLGVTRQISNRDMFPFTLGCVFC